MKKKKKKTKKKTKKKKKNQGGRGEEQDPVHPNPPRALFVFHQHGPLRSWNPTGRERETEPLLRRRRKHVLAALLLVMMKKSDAHREPAWFC